MGCGSGLTPKPRPPRAPKRTAPSRAAVPRPARWHYNALFVIPDAGDQVLPTRAGFGPPNRRPWSKLIPPESNRAARQDDRPKRYTPARRPGGGRFARFHLLNLSALSRSVRPRPGGDLRLLPLRVL